MIVPKHKVSKQRKHTRVASAWTISSPTISECPQCHASIQSHHACKKCGYYDGKQVIATKSEKKEAKK